MSEAEFTWVLLGALFWGMILGAVIAALAGMWVGRKQ